MASIRSPGCHDASKVVQCLERFLVDEQEPHEASELKRTHRDSLIHFNVSCTPSCNVPEYSSNLSPLETWVSVQAFPVYMYSASEAWRCPVVSWFRSWLKTGNAGKTFIRIRTVLCCLSFVRALTHASTASTPRQHASTARHARSTDASVSVCCPSGLVRCLRLLRSVQAYQASTQKVETGRRQTALMAGLGCLATRTQNVARHLPGQPGRIGLPSRYLRSLKLVLSPSTTAMTSQALGIGLGPLKSAWGLRQERAPCRGVE